MNTRKVMIKIAKIIGVAVEIPIYTGLTLVDAAADIIGNVIDQATYIITDCDEDKISKGLDIVMSDD